MYVQTTIVTINEEQTNKEVQINRSVNRVTHYYL